MVGPGPRGAWGRTSCAAAATALALALAAVAPAAVLAVDVRGTVQVPSDVPSIVPPLTDAARQRARYWEEWNGMLDPRPARLDVVRELAVVLTGEGAPSDGEQPPYRLYNGSLSPATLVVRAGAAFQIRNDDAIAYELFADGNDEFGPIGTAPGNARPVTVSGPGSWPVHDRQHPHVVGHLHALPDLVSRAFLEHGGGFTFRGVAAGTYRLHVFHGAREVTSQDVTVVEGTPLQIPAISVTAAAAP